MTKEKKSLIVKFRVTAAEHEALRARARHEGGVSALVRQRVFGRGKLSNRTSAEIRLLARLHAALLDIARRFASDGEAYPRAYLLSELVAIESILQERLTEEDLL